MAKKQDKDPNSTEPIPQPDVPEGTVEESLPDADGGANEGKPEPAQPEVVHAGTEATGNLEGQPIAVPVGTPIAMPQESAPQEPVKMPLANGRLIIGIEGSTTPIKNVTPAEVLVLAILHLPGAKKFPIVNLVTAGETERSVSREYSRLCGKYGAKKVKAIFGPQPRFPETFQAALQSAMTFAGGDLGEGKMWQEEGLPSPDLMTHNLSQ